MPPFIVPDGVRRFIQQHIDSIESMEVLLWLKRRGAEADAETIARDLRSTEHSVTRRLAELARHGLIQPGSAPNTYRYAPVGANDELVAKLADCYRAAPYRTMALVHSKPANGEQ